MQATRSVTTPSPKKKHSALDRLPARTLLDGAMGTQLIARGAKVDKECPEAWNLNRPDDVKQVHENYIEAGADALQTNTFGGNRVCLARFGRQTDVRKLNRVGALLAREAQPSGRLIIGSVGPTGVLPPPDGKANLLDLEEHFAEQAMALAEGGVDMIHIETLYHPKEARAAIRGMRKGAPGMPIVASMTCQRTAAGYKTTCGYPSEVMLSVFLEENVAGVGANCTLSPADMMDLIRQLRSQTEKPIFAQPTIAPSGLPPLLPDELATGALALFAAGATAVGGCCGSGPADIAAVRTALDGLSHSLDALVDG